MRADTMTREVWETEVLFGQELSNFLNLIGRERYLREFDILPTVKGRGITMLNLMCAVIKWTHPSISPCMLIFGMQRRLSILRLS